MFFQFSTGSSDSKGSENCTCGLWEQKQSYQKSALSYKRRNNQSFGPKFSGMNLGDIMKITVLEEMENLKMFRDKPLDLSVKPWNLAKRKESYKQHFPKY